MQTEFPTCHCATCGDEALPGEVLEVDAATGMALVRVGTEAIEVDTTLVDAVAPGGWLLIHGGVAIGSIDT